jgi:hypothetical protein
MRRRTGREPPAAELLNCGVVMCYNLTFVPGNECIGICVESVNAPSSS